MDLGTPIPEPVLLDLRLSILPASDDVPPELRPLLDHEDEVLEWLAADASNRERFAFDPLAALADLLDPDLLQGLRIAQDRLGAGSEWPPGLRLRRVTVEYDGRPAEP